MGQFTGLEHIVREDEPLAPYTWLRLGGPAQFFAEPTSQDELVTLAKRCDEGGIPIRLLGGGSNVLVRAAGVQGLVVHLSAPAFSQLETKDTTLVAGAGAKLAHALSSSVAAGLAGLEPLAGIPGTVGGALRGNAGAGGSDVGQWASRVTMLSRTGEVSTLERDQLRFAYRKSNLDELAILSAEFSLEQDDPEALTKRLQKFWIVKQANQPPTNESSAAVFKDVGGVSAASLIEQAGLKGAQVGEARLSERDPGYVVTGPGATPDDVVQLIERVVAEVSQKLDVELETQLQIW